MATAWPNTQVHGFCGRQHVHARDRLGKRLLAASGILAVLVALILVVMVVAIGDLLERLLERAETRQLPVVVLTGRELTGGERLLLAERNASVLEKRTYSGDQLRWLVRQALGQDGELPATTPLPALQLSRAGSDET